MPAIQETRESFSGQFYLGKKRQFFHSKNKKEGIYHQGMETPLN